MARRKTNLISDVVQTGTGVLGESIMLPGKILHKGHKTKLNIKAGR